MGKNKSDGGFNNRAAQRFSDRGRIEVMRQQEVYDVLDDNEIHIILDQITAWRNGDRMRDGRRCRFPDYTLNMFANVSAALRFFEYVDSRVNNDVDELGKKDRKRTGRYFAVSTSVIDLTPDDAASLRELLFRAFRESKTRGYQDQVQDTEWREEYLSKAFCRLAPEAYAMAKMLKIRKSFDRENPDQISKPLTRELVVLAYGDPGSNMANVARVFDLADAAVPQEIKDDVFLALYENRVSAAMGAALTVNRNDSEFLSKIYDVVKEYATTDGEGETKEERAADKKHAKAALTEVLDWYCQYYKRAKSVYPRFASDTAFHELKRVKRIKKKLANWDEGFRKAEARLGAVAVQRRSFLGQSSRP